MSYLSLHSPLGDLTLFEQDGAIVALEWGRPGWDCPGWGQLGRGQVGAPSPTALLKRAAIALQDYFDTGRLVDALPLNPAGSAYQRNVWAALQAIPAGETRTYTEIAAIAGGSARSVGGANSRNPLPILIPCHRVVATTGLGGYTGASGLVTKRALLALENAAYAVDRPACNYPAPHYRAA
jgi:methylated-DNA-[protein]-cysteine S-methyltransferase